jgi:putative ABC transport system substrate-binding protein
MPALPIFSCSPILPERAHEANGMRRRSLLGATIAVPAAAWPLAARAQGQARPVIAIVSTASADGGAARAAGFRKGLAESGHIEGKNVAIEYHWLSGQTENLPALMAEIVRRQVAVIATPGSIVAFLAARAATTTIPIVFGSPEDPVALGFVASLARPGGNATGVNSFSQETIGKRLALLHDLLPRAGHIAVLIDPKNALSATATMRGVREAAPALGLQLTVLNASTSEEIDAAFAACIRERVDALYVAPDAFFNSQGAQFVRLATVNRLPTSYSAFEVVQAGGLMSYGSDLIDDARQVGVYAGKILDGARPADLPVRQSTRFILAINVKVARTFGIEVPPKMLSLADEVIE